MEISKIGICKIATASIRNNPDNQSFLLSQALFGERVKLLKTKNKHWYKVQCLWDDVIGWVDPKQFYFVEENHPVVTKECQTFALDHYHGASSETATIPIGLGSNLYNCDGINFKMPFGKFHFGGSIIDLQQSLHSKKMLINILKRFLHTPYFQGARSINGTDAAGFIQVAYKMIGINIPRYAIQIANLGNDIGFVREAKEGDLALFGKGQGSISHIGIVTGKREIIHAYGRVKIDKLDQQGIYDLEAKRYSFKLRSIRRLLPLL